MRLVYLVMFPCNDWATLEAADRSFTRLVKVRSACEIRTSAFQEFPQRLSTLLQTGDRPSLGRAMTPDGRWILYVDCLPAQDPGHDWARRTRPVSLAELASTPLVVRESGSGTRVSFEQALAMVREWIVDHVLHHDLILADYTAADA